MNAFERHHIEHLSASSVNRWAQAPALWVLEKLLGYKSGVGIAADRGTATETGVAMGLRNSATPLHVCVKAAEDQFDRLTALKPGDRDKERSALHGFVATAIGELQQYGVPDFPITPPGATYQPQHKVELKLDGVPVPIIGYLDFVYPQHSMIVDLKTTHRVPSAISTSHALQGSVYAQAKGYEVRFAYVSPKKIQVYRLEDVDIHLQTIANIAQRLERFLNISADAKELASLVTPNYDDFYWSDPATRAKGKEVFGF